MKNFKRILALILALLFAALTLAACGKKGGDDDDDEPKDPKTMSVQAMRAEANGDYKTLVKMIHPDGLKYAGLDGKDLSETYAKIREDVKANLTENKIVIADIKCTGVEELDKSEVESYIRRFKSYYNNDDELKKLDDITAVSTATVKVYWEENGEKKDISQEISFIKIDGKWYLGVEESAMIIGEIGREYRSLNSEGEKAEEAKWDDDWEEAEEEDWEEDYGDDW